MSDLSAPVLTLDGPSATGKGTVAAEVAKDCGWGLLDSGALYRAFAYIADQKGVAVHDDAAIRLLGNELDLKCLSVERQRRATIHMKNTKMLNMVLQLTLVLQLYFFLYFYQILKKTTK